MTFPLGRFGDSHVAPDSLFDSSDPAAAPPPAAIDVQFRCPSSLNAMLDQMAKRGRDDLIEDWRTVYGELASDTARFVQRGGRGPDAGRAGLAPARLAITTVVHDQVPGFEVARWHLHVYVGATAVSLLDGQVLDTSFESLDLGVRSVAWPRYVNQLWARTEREWGVRWDEPRPGAEKEIVEPAFHEWIDTLDRGVCPGPPAWGPRRLLLADEVSLRLSAQDERSIARARAEGRGYERPRTLDDDLREDRRRTG